MQNYSLPSKIPLRIYNRNCFFLDMHFRWFFFLAGGGGGGRGENPFPTMLSTVLDSYFISLATLKVSPASALNLG